jgi:hypothetical protein
MNETKQSIDKEYMSVRIAVDTKNELKRLADADKRSLSSMVTLMLERAVIEAQLHAK